MRFGQGYRFDVVLPYQRAGRAAETYTRAGGGVETYTRADTKNGHGFAKISYGFELELEEELRRIRAVALRMVTAWPSRWQKYGFKLKLKDGMRHIRALTQRMVTAWPGLGKNMVLSLN